jgi:hypothetical protein
MRKIDIIYPNLLSLLNNLTIDGDSFVAFHDGILDEEVQNKLLDISEKISFEKGEIIKKQLENEFYPDFTNLLSFLNEYYENFSTFPNFRKNEILASISIIQKLTSEFGGAEDLNLEEEVTIDDFEIVEMNDNIVQDNFLHFDTLDITHSLFLFNINDSTKFKNYIDSLSNEVYILYYLLSKIGTTANPLIAPKYVLVKSTFSEKPKIIWATLCLHIIKTGEVIHNSYEYPLPPAVPLTYLISLGKDYQQFSDSISIISEYNHQKDILDKYLRIYHVFENFMYKSPLVKLERESSGEVFSIRDFKRMYDRINDSEINMLKKLFDNILTLEHIPGQSFNTKILNSWNALIPTHFADTVKINFLINVLNIKTGNGNPIIYGDIIAATLPHFFAKLVYAFRNSMVHNRETEFHLTHQTLQNHPVIENGALIVLENFLLPILEDIVFYLIINENTIVWYNNSILKLWEED